MPTHHPTRLLPTPIPGTPARQAVAATTARPGARWGRRQGGDALDTRTGEQLARISVGSGPHSLAGYPRPGRYSLGHTSIFRRWAAG
ncbi:hypothetical protein ACFQ6E_24080 [Streptomyces sp. NPDC056462]|uniref:hypothetical protein n=1 Tax=Streptomyces sp. NPDC056462 TaxID=3345826 RepID=UPI0036B9FD68